jgi:multiple sugar transport system substrate-binding protein
MVSMAKAGSPSKTKYGYIGQGSQYEGLVCNFVEVVHGYGGDVLDMQDPTRVTVNSPQARAALEQMVSWVGSISPDAITTYQEEAGRNVFQNGDAVFMRNWPYAYKLGNDSSQSKIVGKFDIAPIPYGGSNGVGHSAIGGWNLAINAYSNYPEQSWEFIKFMLEAETQKKIAIDASLTPVLLRTYDDQEVLSKQPLFGKIRPILQNALPRPVSDQYTNVSDAIQRNVYQALKKQTSPRSALSNLEADLKKIVTPQG